jgi:hypothetical protein
MRRTLFGLLALGLLGLPGLASGQEQEAPPMFWVYQERVKPAMTQEYEAATKDLIALFESGGEATASLGWTTISSMENGYYYVMPIESFGGLDEAFGEWMTAVQAVGMDAFREVDSRTRAAMNYAEASVIALRPDLSYLPETVALDPEKPYRKYWWWYLTPGMEDDFEAVAKEFVELYAANNIETGWRIYQGMLGGEMPMYLVVDRAESPYDYAARDKEVMEILGDEAQALGMKAVKTARRIEESDGWFRPDLSFPRAEYEPGETD